MTAPGDDRTWDEPKRLDPAAAAGAGFRVFRQRYPALLRAWLVPALVTIAATVLLAASTAALGLPADPAAQYFSAEDPLTPEESMRYLGVSLPLAFVTYVATFTGWALVARVVRRELDPEAEDAPISWPRVLGLAALLVLLYALGFTLLIVGFLVLFHWFLFAPAFAATDGRGAGDALEASRRFSKQRRTYGFTALVLLVSLVVALVSALIGATFAAALAAAGLPLAYAGAVGGPLGQWLLAPLVPALPAAFVALARKEERAAPAASEGVAVLHRPLDAGGTMSGGGAGAVDAASERAADRFRTTKCPQCGTLVPYMATGSPVDVTCPVCGRAGRVL